MKTLKKLMMIVVFPFFLSSCDGGGGNYEVLNGYWIMSITMMFLGQEVAEEWELIPFQVEGNQIMGGTEEPCSISGGGSSFTIVCEEGPRKC